MGSPPVLRKFKKKKFWETDMTIVRYTRDTTTRKKLVKQMKNPMQRFTRQGIRFSKRILSSTVLITESMQMKKMFHGKHIPCFENVFSVLWFLGRSERAYSSLLFSLWSVAEMQMRTMNFCLTCVNKIPRRQLVSWSVICCRFLASTVSYFTYRVTFALITIHSIGVITRDLFSDSLPQSCNQI